MNIRSIRKTQLRIDFLLKEMGDLADDMLTAQVKGDDLAYLNAKFWYERARAELATLEQETRSAVSPLWLFAAVIALSLFLTFCHGQ